MKFRESSPNLSDIWCFTVRISQCSKRGDRLASEKHRCTFKSLFFRFCELNSPGCLPPSLCVRAACWQVSAHQALRNISRWAQLRCFSEHFSWSWLFLNNQLPWISPVRIPFGLDKLLLTLRSPPAGGHGVGRCKKLQQSLFKRSFVYDICASVYLCVSPECWPLSEPDCRLPPGCQQAVWVFTTSACAPVSPSLPPVVQGGGICASRL